MGGCYKSFSRRWTFVLRGGSFVFGWEPAGLSSSFFQPHRKTSRETDYKNKLSICQAGYAGGRNGDVVSDQA